MHNLTVYKQQKDHVSYIPKHPFNGHDHFENILEYLYKFSLMKKTSMEDFWPNVIPKSLDYVGLDMFMVGC